MRTSRLLLTPLLAAAIATAACSGGNNPLEPQGTETSATLNMPQMDAHLLGGLLGSYMSCTALPAQSSSASIGVLGGVINIGPHKLVIPPGAVLSSKTITAQITAGDTTNSIKFGPAGLTFTLPAVLSISYANCTYGGLLGALQLAYTTDDLGSILELLPAVPNPVNQTVVGAISHFSRYALAY